MKKLRFAFMGFRHGHILGVYNQLKDRGDVETVAACEEDAAARKSLLDGKNVVITHESYRSMLDAVPCDVVAVGDYYGKRGAILIEALKRGKHVISDKPICTSLKELDEIERLAREKNLSVGCQFDLRDSGIFQEMRRLILGGEIGGVHAISFNGEHPLNWGTRPAWYFEKGKHGGTLNDIAVHAIDVIPWLTGLRFKTVNAARNWHVRPAEAPHFNDCAQVMLTMDNGCGVLGDVSYLAPDSQGFSMPQYWQTRFWGEKGLIEGNLVAKEITLYSKSAKEPKVFKPGNGSPGGYLDSFIQEIGGKKEGLSPSSADVFAASRVALQIQEAADKGLSNTTVG
ncbi:MAG: Gfo/Idh/MocA family oxidoreductase [Verrucomicrobiae bacterium]|nr:Gfo/Idh/MocA family oxidoreductase [Verrucomicrobiae bacterium]